MVNVKTNVIQNLLDREERGRGRGTAEKMNRTIKKMNIKYYI